MSLALPLPPGKSEFTKICVQLWQQLEWGKIEKKNAITFRNPSKTEMRRREENPLPGGYYSRQQNSRGRSWLAAAPGCVIKGRTRSLCTAPAAAQPQGQSLSSGPGNCCCQRGTRRENPALSKCPRTAEGEKVQSPQQKPWQSRHLPSCSQSILRCCFNLFQSLFLQVFRAALPIRIAAFPCANRDSALPAQHIPSLRATFCFSQ